MNSLLTSVESSPLFTATAAPYLLLDRDLIIRSANEAYLSATGRALDHLAGEYVFDAFPDNSPDVVQNANSSLESVLRTSQRSYLWVLRYDLPGPTPGHELMLKYWNAINSPIRDDRGRAALILHHAEDVTPACAPAAGHGAEVPAAGTVDWGSPGAARSGLVALSCNAEALAGLAAEVAQLRQALGSRVVIEQAKGIVMAEQHCGPNDAFEILRTLSRNANAKLRDVAAVLVAKAQHRLDTGG
jgi:hypothetical protein